MKRCWCARPRTRRDLVRRQGLLLAAGRPDEAAASLRAGSLRLLFEGGVHVVVRLAEQFPPEFARRSADWQDVAGYAKWRLWRNAEAAQHLEAAEALHRERGDAVAARLSALRRAAMLAGIGRPGAARARAGRRSAEPGPDEVEARIYVHLCQLWIALEEGAGRSVAPLHGRAAGRARAGASARALGGDGAFAAPDRVPRRGPAAAALGRRA